jgi:hypothetical protein
MLITFINNKLMTSSFENDNDMILIKFENRKNFKFRFDLQ